MIFAVIAVASLAFAIYVRAQSPTVIRVDKDGDAAVLVDRARLRVGIFCVSRMRCLSVPPYTLRERDR